MKIGKVSRAIAVKLEGSQYRSLAPIRYAATKTGKVQMKRRKSLLFILFSILLVSENYLYGQVENNCEREYLIGMLKDFYTLDDISQNFALHKAEAYANKSDTTVFPLMLDLRLKADGWIAEGLGSALSQLIVSNTEFFLKSICNKSKEEQKDIATSTFYADGGGLSPKNFIRAQINLNKLKTDKDLKISSVASLFLSVSNDIRNELKK